MRFVLLGSARAMKAARRKHKAGVTSICEGVKAGSRWTSTLAPLQIFIEPKNRAVLRWWFLSIHLGSLQFQHVFLFWLLIDGLFGLGPDP